jgi:putative ABC transport system permease protein
MFRNHFKAAWRNLLRDRQFSFLNLAGLATGLACTLLIYLWVQDELRIDKFHANHHRIYQVHERQKINNNIAVSRTTSGLVAEELKKQMPEVEYAAAVMHYNWFPRFQVFATPNNKLKAVGQFAEKDFFNVFSYKLVQGNKDKVLADKKSIVISEGLAQKLFNSTQNITGKILQWELAGFKREVIVSGVFENIPANSSEQFDFVLHFDDFKDIQPNVLHWGNNGTNAYLLLKEGADVSQFEKKIEGFLKSKMPETDRTLFLTLFADNYLYSKYENGVQSGGRIEYVRMFSIVAVFILIIACINFMNLSTARASRRLKEVGVRKVIGAGRRTLILQYLSESLLMAFLSLAVALLFISLFLPIFNAITTKDIKLEWNTGLTLAVLGITIVTGLLSGSYPALYISGFNPIAVLKGKLRTSVGELFVRKGLVVFQFTLSVVFIVSVLVVYKQVKLIQTRNLGYSKDNIIYFPKEGGIQQKPDAFMDELRSIPGVQSASAADHRFAGTYNLTGGLKWPGSDPANDVAFEVVHADYDLIEMLNIKMKEGRSFSREFGADSSTIILNEAAIKLMGLQDPVGKTVNLWGESREIIGVTKDFHYESLHKNVKPLLMILKPQHAHYIMAKIGAGKEKEVLEKVKHLYSEYNAGAAFDYKFLDQDFQALYVSEQKIAVLSRYFAGLAIIISCLGLFGLAAFTAQRRQKEIGIRKVVGASVSNMALMLSKDFLKLVLIAVLAAFPLAWWAMNQWLDNFAYRVNLSADVFIIAGVAILLISIITISFQSIKAALSNPVESLRSE